MTRTARIKDWDSVKKNSTIDFVIIVTNVRTKIVMITLLRNVQNHSTTVECVLTDMYNTNKVKDAPRDVTSEVTILRY